MPDVQKFLDNLTGLPTLWACIGNKFVAKEAGKGLSTEDFTAALKSKLEGIAAGAEVNQNAFSAVSDGTTTVSAASKTDTLIIEGDGDITVEADSSTKTITIGATIPTYSEATQSAAGLMSAADKTKLDGVATGAEVNQNAYSSITVGSDTLTAASKTAGFEIAAGSNVTVTGDATLGKITIAATDTTYGEATTSAAGLMSAADKTKLDGVETGADANVIETVKVNGTSLTPDSNKAVDVTVPTAVSDLTNDSNFQTDTDVATAIATAVASAYIFKGSVSDESSLPSSGQTTGDVYNIVAASSYGPAGMNVAWTGSAWDALGSSISIDAMTAAEVQAICV